MIDSTPQKELSETENCRLAIPVEIKSVLRKLEVTDYKKKTIRRCSEEIQINTYILTFNKLIIRKEVKIGYSHKREELTVYLRTLKEL